MDKAIANTSKIQIVDFIIRQYLSYIKSLFVVYKTNIALFLSLCLQQEQKNASSFGRPPVFSKKIKLFSLFLFTNAPFYAILYRKKIALWSAPTAVFLSQPVGERIAL
jgi:hypothetical protein